MEKIIIFNIKKNTGEIILNRPSSLNALNLEMALDFKNKLNEWKNDKKIKNVILKGNGKAFCAGGDIKSLYLSKKNSKLKEKFFYEEYKLNNIIKNFPKPYLSLWNGIVMGGGVGLSIYGNYRVATEKTKFAMPESGIGFFPDVGTSYVLSRIPYSLGLFIGLTGYVINYYESYKIGLANFFIKEKNIIKIENFFSKNNYLNDKIQDKIPKIKSELLSNKLLINKHFKNFNIEKIINSLKLDKSIFARKTLETLLNRCPTSLAVTCEQFKRARKISFEKCIEMDYHISQNMVYRKDFSNGVKEVLINKNSNKKWYPNSTLGISKRIKKYFILKNNKNFILLNN